MDVVVDFDASTRRARVHDQGRGTDKVVTLPVGAHDPLATACFLRSQPLGKGDREKMPVFSGEKMYVLSLAAADGGQRHSPARGTVPVMRLQSYARTGHGRERTGRLSGYVEAAGTHTPLMVIIKAPVFTHVIATLVHQEF